MGGFVAAVAAAERARQVRDIVSHLREQKAVSPESAAPVRPERRMGQAALRSMVKDGSVVSAGGDRYWLNETAFAVAQKKRGTRVAWIVAIALLLVALIIWLTPMLTHEL